MNTLKLTKSQLVKSLGNLVSEQSDIEDTFARAVWSLITEPGDTFAAAVIATLGAKDALAAELNLLDAKRYEKLIRELSPGDELQDRFNRFELLLSDARARWQPRLKLNLVENALSIAKTYKAQLLVPGHTSWPNQLSDLGLGVPHCLWLRGKYSTLDACARSLAVVGSRISSTYGQWVTSEIVSACATNQISIISGGAYGIDAMAHRSALALDVPTVAVMAGGIDRIYPSGNSELLGQVIRDGAVIAEQAPGSNPTRWRFLQRNRIIAALATATVVVEAGKRSGAINTAMHCENISRPLGVVPGSINSPTSIGCNNLIKNDPVRMMTSVADVTELVTGEASPELFKDDDLGPLETRAIDAMSRRDADENSIATKAGLTIRELMIALGRLQLLGLVAQGERGWRKVV